jgi:sugar/nucleoside kinase (ribokinase family)
MSAGGPATNAAITCAALGARATRVTALGGHALAQLPADELARHHVTVVDALSASRDPPVLASILIHAGTGERIVMSSGARGQRAEPPERLRELVMNSDAVLVDGHHPALALRAAQLAKAAGVPVLLDAGSWKPCFDDLLPFVDHVCCSSVITPPLARDPDEATGFQTVPSAATKLVQLSRRPDLAKAALSMTCGSGPVLYIHPTDRAVRQLAVPRVDAKDTLGAGDAFHGAYALALARDRHAPIVDLLTFAAEVASLRCSVAGARAWLRTDAFVRLRRYY